MRRATLLFCSLVLTVAAAAALVQAPAEVRGVPAATLLPQAATLWANLPRADSPEFSLPEAPATVPWTMVILPQEEGAGQQVVVNGTMDAPAGVGPDEAITMLVYYSDDPADARWLDPMGLVAPPPGTRIASRIQTYVTRAEGTVFWDFDPALYRPETETPDAAGRGTGARSVSNCLAGIMVPEFL